MSSLFCGRCFTPHTVVALALSASFFFASSSAFCIAMKLGVVLYS